MTAQRFGSLDALRGIAALSVIVLHLEEVHLTGPILPHAFVAVDFFFALSGFVLALMYEARLGTGMTILDFLVRRLIRLYPMIFLGVGCGAAVMLLKVWVDPGRVDPPSRIMIGVLANLLVLPAPYTTIASRGVLFTGDGPLWSVAFEILVNVFWCLVLVRASTRWLVAFVAAGLLGFLTYAILRGTSDIGFDWLTIPGGFVRVGYGFGLGLLAYRFRDRLIGVRRLVSKLAAPLLLVAVFAIPRLTGSAELAVDLCCITLVVPLVLWLGLNAADHPWLDLPLGAVSYPLYAVHFPILLLASGLHQKLPQLALPWVLAAAGLAMAVATPLVMKAYDEPLRRRLDAWWRRQRHGTAPYLMPPEPCMHGRHAPRLVTG